MEKEKKYLWETYDNGTYTNNAHLSNKFKNIKSISEFYEWLKNEMDSFELVENSAFGIKYKLTIDLVHYNCRSLDELFTTLVTNDFVTSVIRLEEEQFYQFKR